MPKGLPPKSKTRSKFDPTEFATSKISALGVEEGKLDPDKIQEFTKVPTEEEPQTELLEPFSLEDTPPTVLEELSEGIDLVLRDKKTKVVAIYRGKTVGKVPEALEDRVRELLIQHNIKARILSLHDKKIFVKIHRV